MDGVFYRGIDAEFNQSKHDSLNIIWVTSDKSYAQEYGDNVTAYKISVSNPINLGFRTLSVSVKFKDVAERIHNRILEQYRNGKIDATRAKKAISVLHKLIKHYGDKMKRVWEWWSDDKNLKILLKYVGFDAIQALEGRGRDDVPTYGLFSSSQLQPIK
jgi:hypothetical protein